MQTNKHAAKANAAIRRLNKVFGNQIRLCDLAADQETCAAIERLADQYEREYAGVIKGESIPHIFVEA